MNNKNINSIINSINSAETEFIRIIWCDNANIIRAKAVHKDSLGNSNYSIGFSEAQQGVPSIYDAVVTETGLTPVVLPLFPTLLAMDVYSET